MTGEAAHGTFDSQEVAIALGVAVLAQLMFVAIFQLPPPKLVQADISNDNAKPIAVTITPLLKLGTKNPTNVPSKWQRRAPVAPPTKTEPTPAPSPLAEKDPTKLPTTRPDAGYSLYLPDAAPPAPGPETPVTDAGGVATASSVQGSEQGASNGTETDPLKARAADQYRATLAGWFVSRFNIRGKIPFDKLKTLHALATVTITDRHVVGFLDRQAERGSDLRRRGSGDARGDPVGRGRAAGAAPHVPGHAGRQPAGQLPVQHPEILRMIRSLLTVPFFSGALLVASQALAADPAPPGGEAQPDESLLGTVDVNGSAGGLPPLPKMAIVPIVTTGSADSLVNLVVHRDLDLSGQFEVLPDDKAPPGPYSHDSALDLPAFAKEGAEYVLRVFARPAEGDSVRTELVAEAFLPPTGGQALAPDAKPAFKGVVGTVTTEVRAASHRLVDQILGALTGRPGGFASEMTYAEKVGRWQRVFVIDADGFDLRSVGPSDATAISPSFGPGNQFFYALSNDFSPFRMVFGPTATPVPITVPGSIMGLAFSPDHQRMAVTVMNEGKSALWVGEQGKLATMAAAPFANHPVFGPMNKLAYVGGTPVQRVYSNGKPISPPGFMASAPVYCDTPQGLMLIYTVGVGTGTDIIASDANGGNIKRLTQHEGSNTYAACSPDGRLVSFFSTGKRGQGAGLFIMPIQRPWLAKKISNEVGEALRWEALPPVK